MITSPEELKQRLIQKVLTYAYKLKFDSVEDELEMATVRHRPEALELLEAQSKFTKKELQILYRGFKNFFKEIFHFLFKGLYHLLLQASKFSPEWVSAEMVDQWGNLTNTSELLGFPGLGVPPPLDLVNFPEVTSLKKVDSPSLSSFQMPNSSHWFSLGTCDLSRHRFLALIMPGTVTLNQIAMSTHQVEYYTMQCTNYDGKSSFKTTEKPPRPTSFHHTA
ncbi:hypothetical protein STEG23_006712 [Scotinomys teguina]